MPEQSSAPEASGAQSEDARTRHNAQQRRRRSQPRPQNRFQDANRGRPGSRRPGPDRPDSDANADTDTADPGEADREQPARARDRDGTQSRRGGRGGRRRGRRGRADYEREPTAPADARGPAPTDDDIDIAPDTQYDDARAGFEPSRRETAPEPTGRDEPTAEPRGSLQALDDEDITEINPNTPPAPVTTDEPRG
jgi:hypothetical protein